jgi:uncharacterized protein (DUF952 family)
LSDLTTLHLTPRDVWERQLKQSEYVPEAYDKDGFIHCTDGDENLLSVANLFYKADSREFVVLTIAVDRLIAEVKCEDPGRIYPHIYGPLNTDAVIDLRSVGRGQDGKFERIEPNA